jgi:hypothetical protein
MTTHIPNLVIHVVNSSNQIIEANGVASTFTREPTATVQFVAGNGKIIETDFAAGSADGRLPAGAAVVVDSTNRIIESDGSQGPFRQASIAVRQVGSGSLASMVLRVVDSSNVVLDRLFGNDPLTPDAPVLTWDTAATDNTPTFTADFDDTTVHAVPDGSNYDVIELNYDTDSGFGSPDSATNTLDAAELLAGTAAFTTGTLADGTWYARVRHNHVVAGVDHYSPWSNTVSQTIAAGGGTAGQPIGLLLVLTKAA